MSWHDLGSTVERKGAAVIVRLRSTDGTNRLTRATVDSLTENLEDLSITETRAPLILTGNERFFSAGADINEISLLSKASAYHFALAGRRLMNAVDHYPATVIAAINGYCMGGGLDLALACDFRICSPNAIFGHRGAALGIMTGWGGTQRLTRLIGKSRALQMFLMAEKLDAQEALGIGLVDSIETNLEKAAIEFAERAYWSETRNKNAR